MNKLSITLCLLLFSYAPLMAQGDGHDGRKGQKRPPKIEQIVTTLTKEQKKSIEKLTQASQVRLHQLEEAQSQIRDSIRQYLDLYEDNSKKLFPLFEREGKLQTEINKEMYRAKMAINKILTVEQHQQVISHAKRNRMTDNHTATPMHKPPYKTEKKHTKPSVSKMDIKD